MCNGIYDCIDRSDESDCSNYYIDYEKEVKLNVCNMTEENRFGSLGEPGDQGFECGSICIPTYIWCEKTSNQYVFFDTFMSLCPEVMKTVNNHFLCKNHSFWEDKKCYKKVGPSVKNSRCKGNSPGVNFINILC
jgi:hypothetical protein